MDAVVDVYLSSEKTRNQCMMAARRRIQEKRQHVGYMKKTVGKVWATGSLGEEG